MILNDFFDFFRSIFSHRSSITEEPLHGIRNINESLRQILDTINIRHVQFMNKAMYYGNTYGTCDRRKVGAVVVKDGSIIGIGFNTALNNTDTCNDHDHFMINGSCKRTIHAEMMAMDSVVKTESSKDFSSLVMYCTDKPCLDCAKQLALYGISKVYYLRDYPSNYDELNLPIEIIQLEVEHDAATTS